MWTRLQLVVFVAVMFSNIHWQWTPNGYLAGLIAAGAAYAVTLALAWLIDLSTRRTGRLRLEPRRQ